MVLSDIPTEVRCSGFPTRYHCITKSAGQLQKNAQLIRENFNLRILRQDNTIANLSSVLNSLIYVPVGYFKEPIFIRHLLDNKGITIYMYIYPYNLHYFFSGGVFLSQLSTPTSFQYHVILLYIHIAIILLRDRITAQFLPYHKIFQSEQLLTGSHKVLSVISCFSTHTTPDL